jgi:D-3-phosphoglycerate dehydrogenase
VTKLRVLHVEPDTYDAEARRTLATFADVDYVACADQHALLAAIANARYEAVICRLGLAVDRHVLDAAPALRYVVTPTTGLDHIDVAEAQRRGIRVVSLRGEREFLETIRSTAEHTFALLLAVIRRITETHDEVLAGRWQRGEPTRLGELAGNTLGVVGCGRLGRMVAGYGVAFGMQVLAFDRDAEQLARAPAGVVAVDADELLARSDVVSLHLPLAPDTDRWLDADRIARMRRGAVLVNTARGELVDEPALLTALASGHIAAAGLDVLAGDGRWDRQVPAEHPLIEYARSHPNVIITPHIGGFGRTSLVRARQFIARRFAEAAQEIV